MYVIITYYTLYIYIHTHALYLLSKPLQLLGNTNFYLANHTAATQCILASRCGEDDVLKFKPSIRMRKKRDLSDFERGMVVGARRAGLSISITADLLGFSHTTISRVYREWSEKEKISSERQLCGRKCLVDVRGQRRMGRLDRDDRKATVDQITTRYNQGMQNTISEHTTRRTMKQMGYSSRRPHRVPLLSAKNRKRRLQVTQAHQNWTIEDWKNIAWSDESWFLLRHSDGRVRIRNKELKSMDPSCLLSTVQAGGGGGSLNATAYPSIVADHVHPFITTVYPSYDGYFQQDNAPCHKAQIISDWFLEHDNVYTVYLYSISQKAWHPLSLLHNDITELLDVRHMVLLHLPLPPLHHVLNRVQVWRHTWPLPHLHLQQQGSCHLGCVFGVEMLENSFWREGIIFCFRMSQYTLESMFPSMNRSYPVPAGRCHTIWVKQVYLRLIRPQDMVPVIHALGQVVFSKLFAGFFCEPASEEASFWDDGHVKRLVAVCGVWSEHWQADFPLLQPLKQCWVHSCICFLKPTSASASNF